MLRSRRWLVALLLLGAAIALRQYSSAGREDFVPKDSDPTPGSRRPSVALILVDTLRRDHVGVYGATRATTPHLDALAAQGVLFERAYSPAPWTKPSAASILTGLYPNTHGATRFRSVLPEALVTLAELFQRADYATGAVVSGHFLSASFGLGQGFDEFDETSLGNEKAITSRQVSSLALAFAERANREDRPFFLLAHYFDPHYAFNDHPEVDFAEKSAGRLQGMEGIELLRAIPDLTAEERAFIVARYDEEIRHTDSAIGDLLRKLEQLNPSRGLLIVVSADHGEEFLERGWLGHTRTLYDELLRVPLILAATDGSIGAGRRVDRIVSTVAIAPTLVELADLDPGETKFQETSLVPLLRGNAEGPERAALGHVDFVPIFRSDARKIAHKNALIGDRYKLIRDEATGQLELYDLREDPMESTDLAESRDDLAKSLAAELDERLDVLRAGAQEPLEGTLSDEEIETLRALGYVRGDR